MNDIHCTSLGNSDSFVIPGEAHAYRDVGGRVMQEQMPSGDPEKSAQRVERPEGAPQGERSESSRCLFSICYWIPACAGMTEYE